MIYHCFVLYLAAGRKQQSPHINGIFRFLGFKPKMVRTALLTSILRATTAGLNLLLILTLTRFLSLEDFGRYSFTMSIVGFLAVFCQFGMSTILIREIVSEEIKNNYKNMISIIAISFLFIISSALITTLVILYLIYGDILLPVKWLRSDFELYGLLILFLLGPLNIAIAILQGRRRILLSVLGEALRPFAVVVVFLLLVLAISATPDTRTALFAQIIGTGIVAGILILLCIRILPRVGWDGRFLTNLRPLFMQGQTIMATDLLRFAVNRADLVFLGILAGTTATGLYAPAAGLVAAISLAQAGINITYGPYIAAFRSEGSVSSLELLAKKACFAASLFAIVPFLVLFSLSDIVLSLFGPDYIAAAGALKILAFSQFFAAAFGISTIILKMLNLERLVLVSLTLAVIAQALTAYLLIPQLSTIGAALSNLVAMGVYIGACTIWVRRKFGFWIRPAVREGIGDFFVIVGRRRMPPQP